MSISKAQLLEIMPYATQRADTFLVPLNQAMDEFEINTSARQAAFLAQVAHESGELRYTHELASGAAYEGRIAKLGNTETGDGPRFKGRGLLEITGRNNYTKYGALLGLDLVAHPELLETTVNGCRVSACFWKDHGLNELADEGRFHQITLIINGGYNGEPFREAYWKRAIQALGVFPEHFSS